MPSLGWQELTIVLVIVIIIFGAGRLPEIGGALGKSIKEFKSNSEDDAANAQLKTGTTATKERVVDDAKVVETREVRPDEI
jgi:sec-independent protein translocase protein TatA